MKLAGKFACGRQGRQGRQGTVRRTGARGHRPRVRHARGVRRPAVPQRDLPGAAAGRQHHRRHGPAPQPDPASPTGRRQHDPLAGRLQPGPLRGHVLQPRWRSTTRRSRRTATPSRATSSIGSRSRSTRPATARNYCGSIVCATSMAFVRDAMTAGYNEQLRPARRTAQIADYLKKFDIGTGTTSTATATSTSPTATSTTSRSSTPAATRDRRRRPGTDAIWSHRWYAYLQGVGPDGLAGVNIGSTPACPLGDPEQPDGRLGRRLHRRAGERRRSASSPTSTATTSACPTSTTPPATPAAPRTPRASGRSCRPAATSATAAGRHRRRADRPRRLGEAPARLAELRGYGSSTRASRKSAQARPGRRRTRSRRRRLFVLLPDKEVAGGPRRALRRRSSTSPARATSSTTR